MTIIACDGRYLAADSAETSGNGAITEVNKLVFVTNPHPSCFSGEKRDWACVAVCGSPVNELAIRHWLQTGVKGEVIKMDTSNTSETIGVIILASRDPSTIGHAYGFLTSHNFQVLYRPPPLAAASYQVATLSLLQAKVPAAEAVKLVRDNSDLCNPFPIRVFDSQTQMIGEFN